MAIDISSDTTVNNLPIASNNELPGRVDEDMDMEDAPPSPAQGPFRPSTHSNLYVSMMAPMTEQARIDWLLSNWRVMYDEIVEWQQYYAEKYQRDPQQEYLDNYYALTKRREDSYEYATVYQRQLDTIEETKRKRCFSKTNSDLSFSLPVAKIRRTTATEQPTSTVPQFGADAPDATRVNIEFQHLQIAGATNAASQMNNNLPSPRTRAAAISQPPTIGSLADPTAATTTLPGMIDQWNKAMVIGEDSGSSNAKPSSPPLPSRIEPVAGPSSGLPGIIDRFSRAMLINHGNDSDSD